ncbi:MAG: phosphatase PAP2 family protein [Lysinibacillus sp.]
MKNWMLILAFVTFLVFVFLMYTFDTPPLINFDKEMASLMEGNKFIEWFHYLGETKFIYSVGIVLLIWLWFYKGNYYGMFLVLLTYPVGFLLNQLIKRIVERPRPDIADQLASFSFPSGHAMMGMLYLLTIAYFLSKEFVDKKKSTIIWFVAIILIILIGLSRIAGSRHFATDVIAGWSLGYTWFVLCMLWYETRKRQSKIEDA